MIYSLKKPENVVTKLHAGASITSRCLTAPVLEVAMATARKLSREALANADLLKELGLDPERDAKNDAAGDGLYRYFLRLELGVRLIVAWNNIGVEGESTPARDDVIRAFVQIPSIASQFYDDVMIQPSLMALAKKDSGTAASGTSGSAADPNTAKDAGN